MQQHIVVPKWTMIFNSYRRISVTLIFRIFVVFVNSCIFCTSFTAQASNIDSLENVLASFKGSNLEKGNLLIDLSNIYWRSGDTVKMKASILDAINLAQKEGLEHVEKRAYTSLGNYYSTAQDYYLAHFYYKKAEKLCIMLNDTEYLCTIYFSLLRSFMFIEDHLNMLFYADKLLETISEWYDIETLIPIDSTKINLNDRMQRYIVTAQYYKGVATLSNEIPQDRLDFFIGLFQKTNIPNEGLLEMRIVSAIECGNIYAQINQPRKALQYLHFAREHSEFYLMPGSVKYLSTANALIAEAYAKLNQMDSAIYYINQLGETQLFFDHFAYSLHYRARIAIETAKGNYQKAFEIQKEFFFFTDSISKAEKSEDMARMKNWQELEQKDLENEFLQEERQKQQKLIKILTVALILIFALFPLIIIFYRKTTKKNSELQKEHTEKDKLFSVMSLQKDDIERKNRDISDSINYAKRIQTSILPPSDILEVTFPDSFIYFAPRGEVSGDFYWVTEIKGKLLCCCADGIGHGVPGAFMSMIGATLLNDIVKRPEILSPADILTRLDFEITSLLQKNIEEHSQEGLDMSIVEIDLQTYKIKIASAKRPVYLYSNDELTVYKGVRRSIGDQISDYNAPPFVNIEYVGKPNDKIYLFSDGYADQFGGPHGKKLMISAVKQMLDEIHHKPMKEQFGIIKNNFLNWKNTQEQVDDVVFIGIGL
ncbi:MAG: SpoIIE family protein phosphatase [Marinilabiliaceae bacterium]|nr:SpoIIE family protein phosphatase [Marinilabiliaceae bacterium]